MPDGRIDPEAADVQWEERTIPLRGNGAVGEALIQSRAIREGYQARLAKLEWEERSGKMVSADEVRIAALNKYRQFRDAMLAIPDRVASMLAAETHEVAIHTVLSNEIRKALNDFADAAKG